MDPNPDSHPAAGARSRPRNRFVPDPAASIRLTERDLALLAEAFLQRLVTREQIVALGFFQSVQRCNARCRLLFDHALLMRHRLPIAVSRIVAMP